ncbi:MAG: acetoacetate decarboxylase family protein [Actinomycetota bacterium]|nr:acetoacetate decarboxylase family protein [Actinomycetota bacterium]
MTANKGFFYPRTTTGKASLIPSPPWYYSGDLLTVEYRTDPANVERLLPAGVDLASDDPGAVAFIFADWQSCSTSREELLDPVRSQYKEAFVVVRCSYKGVVYSRCLFIWVDKDFAIARGLFQGYPKKLGSIYQTRSHPIAFAAPQVGIGATFAGTLAANDRRIANVVVTLERESETNGFVNALPMLHSRVIPSIEVDGSDALNELIVSSGSKFQGGQAYSGSAKIELFDDPYEEIATLSVDEYIGGYYRQVGAVFEKGSPA